jgi:hypothetical protein
MDHSVYNSHDIGKGLSTWQSLYSSHGQEVASYNEEDRKFCSVNSTTKYKVRYVSISLKVSALVLKFKRLSPTLLRRKLFARLRV